MTTNIVRLFLLLSLSPSPCLSFWDWNNPPSFASTWSTEGRYATSSRSYPDNTCEIRIHEQNGIGNASTGLGQYIWYKLTVPISECFGLPLDNVPDPIPEATMRALSQRVIGVPVPFQPYPREAYYVPTGYCETQLLVRKGNTTYGLTHDFWGRGCGDQTPVSCSIQAPQVLSHPPATTGRVRTESAGGLTVQCNRTASVTIEVPDSSVRLRGNAGGELRSTIRVGTKTSTRITVTADPVANISVWSTIDDTAETAGIYNGSTIMTVQWD